MGQEPTIEKDIELYMGIPTQIPTEIPIETDREIATFPKVLFRLQINFIADLIWVCPISDLPDTGQYCI